MAKKEIYDASAKVWEYEKDGKTKYRYSSVWVAFMNTETWSITFNLELFPTDPNWDRTIFLNKRETKEEREMREGAKRAEQAEQVGEPF